MGIDRDLNGEVGEELFNDVLADTKITKVFIQLLW